MTAFTVIDRDWSWSPLGWLQAWRRRRIGRIAREAHERGLAMQRHPSWRSRTSN